MYTGRETWIVVGTDERPWPSPQHPHRAAPRRHGTDRACPPRRRRPARLFGVGRARQRCRSAHHRDPRTGKERPMILELAPASAFMAPPVCTPETVTTKPGVAV